MKLGFRRELERIEDPVERGKRAAELVGSLYEQGKAANVATYFEIDEVIDPADSRRWILQALISARPRPPSEYRSIDAW